MGAAAPVAVTAQHSPWHSPVPYLFGGLAAMLGLIAFALLILACSYWKLSGYLERGDGDGGAGEEDPESGGAKGGVEAAAVAVVYEEKYLVIMAGEEKPTFLATPATSKGSSLNDASGNYTCSNSSTHKPQEEEEEATKQEESCDQVDSRNGETHDESSDQVH